jgi:hypothetical protein
MYVYDYIRLTRDPLLKGRGQYSRPSCTKQFISAPLYIENVIQLCHKQATLMRSSMVLRLSLKLVFLAVTFKDGQDKEFDILSLCII